MGNSFIKVTAKGDFKKTNGFLERCKNVFKIGTLDKYGKEGVERLKAATPVDTGKTADSWTYQIDRSEGVTQLEFHNSNINDGENIAILLQYGHGTGTGGYVEGQDYINPALVETFDNAANEIWEEVRNS